MTKYTAEAEAGWFGIDYVFGSYSMKTLMKIIEKLQFGDSKDKTRLGNGSIEIKSKVNKEKDIKETLKNVSNKSQLKYIK